MDNVKDLTPTPENNAPKQLNTVTLGEVTQNSEVNISTVGGLTGVDNSGTSKRPTIKVSANKLKNKRSNSSTSRIVDPNSIIPKKKEEKPVNTIQDNAMNLLDKAVRRKQEEFREFVEQATADDERNRERVQEGLDEINGEINYLPQDLPAEITKDPNAKTKEQTAHISEVSRKEATLSDDGNYIDDVEKDLEEEYFDDEPLLAKAEARSNVRIADPFVEDLLDDDMEEEISMSNDYEVDDIDLDEDEIVEEDIDEEIVEEEEDEIIEVPADTVEEIDEEEIVDEEEVVDDEPEVVEEKKEETPQVEEDPAEELTRNAIKVVSKADTTPDTTVENATQKDLDLDEEDFEDVTYDGENEEQLTDDQILEVSKVANKNLKNEILKKIINVGKTLNTTGFVVSSKIVSAKDAVKVQPKVEAREAKFPLMFAGRPFISSALKGPDVTFLYTFDDSNRQNGVGITLQQARIMYEHDANPYKPKTLEGWSKTIPSVDVENIFAAMYLATLESANFIPYSCPKVSCQHAFLHDAGSIMDMIKFTNDEQKEEFNRILNLKLTDDNSNSYESVINIINDNFAIGLKMPSLFTTLYELNSINDEFYKKYSNIINILQFVDYLYIIDAETNSFKPIGWKTYPGNHTKTFKSKIATYAKILKEFSDMDFSLVTALASAMVTKMTENRYISFETPALKCPKCGSDIVSQAMSARGMVFMRQQLVELATTPTEK